MLSKQPILLQLFYFYARAGNQQGIFNVPIEECLESQP